MKKLSNNSLYFFLAILLISTLKVNGQDTEAKARAHGYPGRCISLNVYNDFDVAISFKINPGSCYEGDRISESNLILPGETVELPITLCRVQGHGCDGRNGEFTIEIMSPGVYQGRFISLAFSNDLGLWISNHQQVEGTLSERQFENINGTNFCFYDLRISDAPLKARAHGYPGRCFSLNVYNRFDVPIRFKVNPSNCYEGDVISETPEIQPGEGYPIGLCRVQGNDCDGKNGNFDIEITSPTELQGRNISMAFSNDLGLWNSATLPGAERDWDSDGLYISKYGVPVIYTVKSVEGNNVQIYQVTPD